MGLLDRLGKAHMRRGLPPEARRLRRHFPAMWEEGAQSGALRATGALLGTKPPPLPLDLQGLMQRAFLEAEDAAHDVFLRLTIQEGLPKDAVKQDHLDAFMFGFVEGFMDGCISGS